MKPEILLIHGFRGNPSGLAEIGAHLTYQGYKVSNPSIPPFGESKALERYDKAEYADFIANYIKENGLKKPILVGHSMGSLVASATAEKYPELINDKLILLAPIAAKPARPIAILNPLAVHVPRRLIDDGTTLYLMIRQDRATTKKTFKLTHAASKLYTSKRDVVEAGRFSCKYEIGDFNFTKNLLLLGGAKDHLVNRKKVQKLAEKFSAKMPVKTVFIQKTGHLLNYEKPIETATEIIKFIES